MRQEITLRIYALSGGRFEVREQDRVLGTSQNEMMAVWTAVSSAQEMAKSGQETRVIVCRDGKEIEHFIAKPPALG